VKAKIHDAHAHRFAGSGKNAPVYLLDLSLQWVVFAYSGPREYELLGGPKAALEHTHGVVIQRNRPGII
jgi:hypothetical protein